MGSGCLRWKNTRHIHRPRKAQKEKKVTVHEKAGDRDEMNLRAAQQAFRHEKSGVI